MNLARAMTDPRLMEAEQPTQMVAPELQHPMHAITAPISAAPIDPMMAYESSLAEKPPTMADGAPDEQAAPQQMAPMDKYKNTLAQKQMADYDKDANPYGSANNHPGFFGKVLHGLSVATGGPNRRQFEEQQRAGQIQGIEKEQSAEGLQAAQTSEAKARVPLTNAEAQQKQAEADAYPAQQQATLEETQARTAALGRPDLAHAYATAVQGAMQAGKDPLTDPLVTHIADAIRAIQPERVTSAKEGVQKQLIDAEQRGDAPTVKRLQQQLKDMDPMGQQRLQVTVQGQQMANDRALHTANRQEIRLHDKAYVQPAESVEKSYDMMDNAFKEYKAARKAGKQLPTGAQSMLALSTHLSTTFGNVKGARVTKDMIHEHLGARSIGDDALVAVQKLTNGDQLSPGQWSAFHELIQQSRNLSWQTAIKEAARKQIPIDFLPPDLQTRTVGGQTYHIADDGQYHLQGGTQ